MITTPKTNTAAPAKGRSDMWLGLVFLGLNLLISVAAQFMLKAAMLNMGAFEAEGDWMTYILRMINVEVISGLVLYGLGTVLWILCLTKLDLSLAYPAGTLQYLLIFVGAWFIFDEQINLLRFLGMLVIIAGVLVMSLDLRKS